MRGRWTRSPCQAHTAGFSNKEESESGESSGRLLALNKNNYDRPMILDEGEKGVNGNELMNRRTYQGGNRKLINHSNWIARISASSSTRRGGIDAARHRKSRCANSRFSSSIFSSVLICFVQCLRQVIQDLPNTDRKRATQPVNLADDLAEPTKPCERFIAEPKTRDETCDDLHAIRLAR